MGFQQRGLTIVCVLALVGALTSCVTTPTAPAASERPPATASTVPSSPPPSAQATATVIDFGGVGALLVGDSVAQANAKLAGYSRADQATCPFPAFVKAGAPSIWLPDTTDAGMVDEVVIQGWGEPSAVALGSPRTSSGIGVGSSVSDLLAAYADIEQVDAAAGTYYTLAGPGGRWMNFASADGATVDSIVLRDEPKIDSEYCG